jgi:plastocyanin
MHRTFTLIAIGCSAAFALACSNSNPQNDAGSDSGNPVDSGGDGNTGINGCTTFTDLTADGGVITGPSGAVAAQYSPNCVHVKVGQSITWNSDFTNHPLVPTAGVGTQPNPITPTSTGSTVTFAFPQPGTFAYNCGIHSTIMLGAVEVTP